MINIKQDGKHRFVFLLGIALLIGVSSIIFVAYNEQNYPFYDDTYIRSGSPTTNYGSSTSITFTDSSYKALIYRDYLTNWSGVSWGPVPLGSTIEHAYLYVKYSTATTGDIKYAYPLMVNWSESAATWNTRLGTSVANWSTPGLAANVDYNASPDFVATGTGGTGWQYWDVTKWVNETVQARQPNYGWLLINQDTSTHTFYSSEYSNEAYRPYLDIKYYYPEPKFSNLTPPMSTSDIPNKIYISENNPVVNFTCKNYFEGAATVHGIDTLVFILSTSDGDSFIDNIIEWNETIYNETSTPPMTYWAYRDDFVYNFSANRTLTPDGIYYWDCGSEVTLQGMGGYDIVVGFFSATYWNATEFALHPDTYQQHFNQIIYDTTAPNITFVGPTPSAGAKTIDNSVTINVSTDEISLDTCILILNNTVSITNYTMTKDSEGNYCSYTFATTDGTRYFYQVWANDSLAHTNITPLRNFTENSEPTIPTTVTMIPNPAYNNATFSCTASGSTDAEGDTLTYYYQFGNSSTVLQAFGTENIFVCIENQCKKGTVINCSAKAYDGYDYSVINSTTITTSNVLPVINAWNISNSTWSIGSGTNIDIYENATNGTYTFNITNVSDQDTIQKWCYQEDYDTATSCGGLATGVSGWTGAWTSLANAYDNNWSTYAYGVPSPGGSLWINYTKPLNSTSASLWQVRDGGGTVNLSIPASCWDYNSVKVMLRVYSLSPSVTWSCYNGSWVTLRTDSTNNYVYEEAMIWRIILERETHWYDWFVNGVKKTVSAIQSWWNWVLGSDVVGSYNVTAVVNDTSNGQVTQYWNVTIHDVTNPTISIAVPADNSWFNTNSLSLNFTYFDVHPQACWYTNNSGINNYTIASCANTTITLADGTSYNITVYINDTSNNVGSDTAYNVSVDTTKPLIDWGVGTAVSGANLSQSWIFANVTVTEANFKNITFTLRNDTTIVNTTTYTTSIYYINWTNLVDNNYTYYVNITDKAGNQNGTSIRYILIDDTNPSASQISPSANQYNSTTSHNFTASATDNTGIKNITLFIYNQSNDLVNQTAVTYTTRVTSTVVGVVVNLVEGVFHWFYKVFDWSGNSYQTGNRTLTIDQTKPLISYNPSTTGNATWVTDGNILINVSASDTNINQVQFQWQGVNETFTSSSGSNYWKIKSDLMTGTYNFFAWVNDLAGNFNSTLMRTVYVDRENPVVTITRPQTINYNVNTSLPLNISFNDVNLQTCWWNLDNGANITITCGHNYTFNASEGTHTVYAFANDTSGRVGTNNVTFTVNLAPPSITLDSPSDDVWLNSTNVSIKWTASDTDGISTCELWGTWGTGWHLNESVTSVTSGVQVSKSKIIADGSYIWNVRCNDTGNNWAWGNPISNNTFSVDSIYPLISYDSSTAADQLNQTSTNIYVKVSVTESNEEIIIFLLYNSTGQINLTSSTSALREVNWTNLTDDTYYFNVTINDSANNVNYTTTRTVRIDTTGPDITINYPETINYNYNESLVLNTTITDNVVGVDKCWFSVENESGYVFYNNVIFDCVNTTFSLPSGDIDYVINVYANDTLGNYDNTGTTFGIRTKRPAVVLNNPTSNQYINRLTDIQFNVTPSDREGISTCELWGNWSTGWHKNQTLTTVTNGVSNNFDLLNLTEGTFIWNVWCNDTNSWDDWALNNLTFTTDITNPAVSFTTSNGSSVETSFTFNYVVTDLHQGTCYFNLWSDSIGWIFSPNQTTSCTATSKSTSVSAGTYQLYLWAYDLAGNTNSSVITITATTPVSPSPGGGSSSSEPIPVHNLSWGMYTNEQKTMTNYIFEMVGGSVRDREIYFYNDEPTEIFVFLTCEDGDICQYVTIEKSNITLPVGLDIPTVVNFELKIPVDMKDGRYVFNIKGTDQQGKEQLITVTANVGVAGATIEAFTKLGSSKDIWGIKIPYLIIVFFTMAITFVLFNYLFLRNINLGLALSIVIALFAGIFMLFVI